MSTAKSPFLGPELINAFSETIPFPLNTPMDEKHCMLLKACPFSKAFNMSFSLDEIMILMAFPDWKFTSNSTASPFLGPSDNVMFTEERARISSSSSSLRHFGAHSLTQASFCMLPVSIVLFYWKTAHIIRNISDSYSLSRYCNLHDWAVSGRHHHSRCWTHRPQQHRLEVLPRSDCADILPYHLRVLYVPRN